MERSESEKKSELGVENCPLQHTVFAFYFLLQSFLIKTFVSDSLVHLLWCIRGIKMSENTVKNQKKKPRKNSPCKETRKHRYITTGDVPLSELNLQKEDQCTKRLEKRKLASQPAVIWVIQSY